jgi:CDP-ribitol ribitolphosphotransferase
MGLQKLILNIILGFLNIFVKRFKIKENQVAFVSLESKYLDSDQPVTIEQLDVGKYQFTKEVLSRLETLSLEEKELFDKKMKFMTPREKEVYLKEFGKNKK